VGQSRDDGKNTGRWRDPVSLASYGDEMAFTFFFRDITVLNLIAEHVIPDLAGFSRIRIWDGGCAMGPEPYSLAMIIAEKMGHFAFRNVRIDATDIDEQGAFEKTIEDGSYPEEQVKRIPPEIFSKYFVPAEKPGFFRVTDTIRSSIRFQRHNLQSLKPIGAGYHLILCKNVLLHFQPHERIEVIKMFYSALAPGGYFATEQTQKMPEQLAGHFSQVAQEGQLFRKIETLT
jgi:chemotaxis protein methyltransferase CheR